MCVAEPRRATAEAAASLTWIGSVREGPAEVELLSGGAAQTVRGFHHRL